MENGRKRVVRIFRSAAVRGCCSVRYWWKLAVVIIMALFSPYILGMVSEAAKNLPDQLAEVFRQGSGYNIGILTVPSLELNTLTRADELVMGILSGSVTQCVIAFITTSFIAREFDGGYINLAMMHGEKRLLIYLKYTGVCAAMSLPAIAAAPICVGIALSVGYGLRIEDFASVLATLGVQAIMLLAMTVCFVSISVALDGRGASVIALCSVLALPIVPNYIRAFTEDKIRLDGLFLISRLVNSAGNIAVHAAGDLLTAAVTAMIFFGMGQIIFSQKKFD